MFLILENRPTCFTAALASYAGRKGLTPVILSSQELSEGTLTFQLNHQGAEFLFEHRELRVEGSNVKGCFCSFHTFSPSLWPGFSEPDAMYAATESHALWLSIMHSMKARMVNEPSPDSLCGIALTPTELYARASEHGLNVPMLLYTESSDAVKKLLETGHFLQVSNLGSVPAGSIVINRENPEDLPDSDNCHLVTETLSGIRYGVCFAGGKLMISTGIYTGKVIRCDSTRIPESVLEGLKKLAEDLEHKLCEFILVEIYNGEWILESASGIPVATWHAWEEFFLQAVLDIPLKQTNREWGGR